MSKIEKQMKLIQFRLKKLMLKTVNWILTVKTSSLRIISIISEMVVTQLKLIQYNLKQLKYMTCICSLKTIISFAMLISNLSEKVVKPLYRIIDDWLQSNIIIFEILILILSLPVSLELINLVVEYMAEKGQHLNFETISATVNIIIFFIYLRGICKLLKEGRKLSFQEKTSIKYAYILFAWFYCGIISISFLKGTILLTKFEDSLTLPSIMKVGEIYGYNYYEIIWGSLNSLKESIVAAIIFDTAYQMFNYNLGESQKKYLKILANHGRLYMLSEDKDKEHPRIWLIRGDGCADIGDECRKYRLRVYKNFDIKYTCEQAAEIIEERRKRFGIEKNECFYDYQSKKPTYYFWFKLLDSSNFDTKIFNQEEIFEIIKNDIIVLPAGLFVKDKGIKVIIEKMIFHTKKLIEKLEQGISK